MIIQEEKIKTFSSDIGGRWYEVKPGVYLPSVTTVNGFGQDKSWLTQWENRIGKEEAARKSTYAMNRGTFMHLIIEKYLHLRYIEKDESKILSKSIRLALEDPEIQPYKDDAKMAGKDLFLQMYEYDMFSRITDVVIQEVALWSFIGGGYAGRVDLVAMRDNELLIIDFKSSNKPKRDEWIEGYKRQIAAYSIAYFSKYGIAPVGGEIWIGVDQATAPQVFRMTAEEIKKYFKDFYELVVGYHKTYPNPKILTNTEGI